MAVAALACAVLPVAGAQAQPAAGIEVSVQIDGMTETYARGETPLSFVVSRLRLDHVLSASGSGLIATAPITGEKGRIDETYPPGAEPRGFALEKGRNGQPLLRVWADQLPRGAVVEARFLRGGWADLAAGRAVALVASVRALQRIHGVAEQLGKAIGLGLRRQLADAVPFLTIQVGDPVLQSLRLDGDDVVLEGSRNGLTATYPDAQATYAAPVSIGR
ncbi:MAG: hypothetical protein GC201_03145 [Alphaproteobacteria bacterium]|nr:hypothetical protein [Alphaproteobacteria bacterium]